MNDLPLCIERKQKKKKKKKNNNKKKKQQKKKQKKKTRQPGLLQLRNCQSQHLSRNTFSDAALIFVVLSVVMYITRSNNVLLFKW